MRPLDPKFCLVPFTNFSISPRGIIRSCCNQYERSMHTTWENIKDLTDVQWPTPNIEKLQKKMLGDNIEKTCPECEVCWNFENMGRESYRTNYNTFWLNRLGDENVEKVLDNPKLNTLDLQFGHVCNNSCVMCNTSLSSQLYVTKSKMHKNSTDEEQKKFYEKDLNYIKDHMDWTSDDYSYEKVKNLCKDIDVIKISGGEPIFNPRFPEFLEYIVNKEIPIRRIHLTTNGTIYNQFVVDQLNKIKEKVQVKFSIEAIGEQEEFIRWPTNWEEKESNIIKYIEAIEHEGKETTIEISSCIQSLTLTSINNVKYFVEKLQARFPEKNIIHSKQPVSAGDIASAMHSDNEYLEFCKKLYTERIYKHIELSQKYSKKETKKQVLYYLDFAKLQNIDFAKTFPVYWKYHKKYVE